VANTVTIQVDADTKAAEDSVKGMGKKFQSAMKGVAMAGAGLTAAAVGASALGQEYQEATNLIASGTGATGSDLEGLKDSFKDVWSEVPQDASSVAQALADVNTELGFQGEDLEGVTKSFLEASRVMGEEASPMIKAVTDSLIAFGVEASPENIAGQLDKLMAASQAVGEPMTGLADTVIKFGPQLQEMGLSLDEATALIANMDEKGLSATKMMPGLNTAIKGLADEGVTDIKGGLQDMIDGIQNAETDAEALALATDAFGAGAGVRFKDAIQKGAFELDGMVKLMEDGEGRVAEMGKETLTTSDKFDVMKNKVKESLTPIGNFANTIGPMVIMIPTLATGISAMAASQTIATAATWLQTAAMSALNIAMGPIGLIILGIAAAIGAGILIWKNWDKIVEVFKQGIENIKPVFETVKEFLEGALDNLKGKWDKIWNGMGDTVKFVWDGIKGYINLWIDALNFLIRGANQIKIEMPDWVPGIGGKGFQMNIAEIPKLASGGIVTSPTLAMIGEGGPEAVIPLNKAGSGITININGPTYGFDDFEEKVGEAIVDGVRRGGFSGILATG
jgi:phage-related minor tail protein